MAWPDICDPIIIDKSTPRTKKTDKSHECYRGWHHDKDDDNNDDDNDDDDSDDEDGEQTTRFCILMQSQRGSIHSPQRMRKIIMKEWKKSVKFHLKENNHTQELKKKNMI